MNSISATLSSVDAWVFITVVIAVYSIAKQIITSLWKTFMVGHTKMNEKEEREELLEKHDKIIEQLVKDSEQTHSMLKHQNELISQLLIDIKGIRVCIDNLQEADEALKDGLRSVLKEHLRQAHKHYIQEGQISESGRTNIEEIFEVYSKRLHGNGVGEVYYKDIMSLPIKNCDSYLD